MISYTIDTSKYSWHGGCGHADSEPIGHLWEVLHAAVPLLPPDAHGVLLGVNVLRAGGSWEDRLFNIRIRVYRVSSETVYTLILLFSRLPDHIQKNFWPFFNSPGDEDFKTHLTLLPNWKIDQVTAHDVRQTWFWKYHFDGRFCFFIEGVANFRVNYLSHF